MNKAAVEEAHADARRKLSAFVAEQARLTAHQVGFGWSATPTAPSEYDTLREAYDRSKASGEPLPVSSLFCTNVIYTDTPTNYAMRFWHDAHHVQLGLSFDPLDELDLGLWHMNQLEQAGFSRHSVEYAMLKIDTVGQNYLLAVSGRFPLNQREFVSRCLRVGVDEGVLAEVREVA